jgi:hypothetical protein
MVRGVSSMSRSSVAKAMEKTKVETSGDALHRLYKMAAAVDTLDNNIAKREDEIKEARKQKQTLLREDIPDLMEEAGVEEFKTKSGLKVTVKRNELYAHISQANQKAAYKWLKAHGYGHMIKGTMNIVLDLEAEGAEEAVGALEEICDTHEYGYEEKQSIHAATLKSFIKSLREERSTAPKPNIKRLNPPEAIFGIYEYSEAKVKKG